MSDTAMLDRPAPSRLTGEAAVRRQIELVTGSPDTPVHFTCIRPSIDGAKSETYPAFGRVDQWIEIAVQRANDGWNCYFRAQDCDPAKEYPEKGDVRAMRCVYIDDDSEGPDKKPLPTFHCEPTFSLIQEETGRRWTVWALGAGEMTPDEGGEKLKDLAAHYGTDTQPTSESSLVRLAGLPRWKVEGPEGAKVRKRYAPYKLVEHAVEYVTTKQEHAAIPRRASALPKSTTPSDRQTERELCTWEAMRKVLDKIPVDSLTHAKATAIRAAFQEAKIEDDDRQVSDDEVDDQLTQWSAQHPNYDEGGVRRSMEKTRRDFEAGTRPSNPAGLGSVVALMRDRGYPDWRPHPLFKPVVREPGAQSAVHTTEDGGKATSRHKLDDWDEADQEPDLQFIIPDCLPCDASAYLHGPRGTGKTFVAIDIGFSTAAGPGAGNGRMWPAIDHPGAVLFAAGEGGKGLKKRRWAWVKKHNGGRPLTNFVQAKTVPLVRSDVDIDAFIASAKEKARQMGLPGFRLVIIDTVIRSMAGLNINAQQDAGLYTQMVDRIRRELAPDEHGCTVLSLHHPGQSDTAQDRSAGSFVFEADADTVIRIERADKSETAELHMTKQKDGEVWDEPKIIRLAKVQFSDDPKDSSAVVCAASAAEKAQHEPASTGTAASRRGGGRHAKTTVHDVRMAIRQVLRSHGPTYERTDTELANMLTQKLGVSPETLKRHYFGSIKPIEGAGFAEDGKWKTRALSEDSPFAPVGGTINALASTPANANPERRKRVG